MAAYPGRFAGLLRLKETRDFPVLRDRPAGDHFDSSLIGGPEVSACYQRSIVRSENSGPVLAVGALWILAVEWFRPKGKTAGVDSITWKQALSIGCFQCLSLWPGMSRAASTILGGMISGLERKTATEYSFFAAVPIMIAATGFELYKSYKYLNAENLGMIAIGFVVSFIFAWLAVKFFIHFLSRHTLTPFGWYRLVVAVLVIWWVVY